MNAASTAFSLSKSNAVSAIVVGGLLVGILDLLSSFAVFGARGVKPNRVLQGISSGLLGPASFQGGARTAALGVILHFTIAFGAATVYYVASRSLNILVERAILCGVLYGAAVHFFMSFVVIPLSAVVRRPPSAVLFMTILLVHMVVVGPPIALSVRYFSK